MTQGREEVKFGGLYNSIDQAKIGNQNCYSMQNASVDRGILEARNGYAHLTQASGASAADVGYGMTHCEFEQNTVYKFESTNTALGSVKFTVTNIFGTANTDAINLQQLTSSQLKDKLAALSNMKPGDVDVSGTVHPGGKSFITFKGRLAGTSVTMTMDDGGVSQGSVTLTQVTEGGLYEEILWVVDLGGLGGTNASLWRYNLQTQAVEQIYTGMIADDWYFQQYADKVYMVSRHNAMLEYTIGGGVQSFDPPDPPPGFSPGNFCERLDSTTIPNFLEWSVGNLTGMPAGATIAFENQATGTSIKITNGGTPFSGVGTISFDLTPTEAKNFSHNDAFSIITRSNDDGVQVIPNQAPNAFLLTIPSGTVTPDDNWIWSFTNVPPTLIVAGMYHFKDATGATYTRDLRRSVTKITVTLNVALFPANKAISVRLVGGRTWMLDTRAFQTAPPAWDLFPKNFKVTDESTDNYPTYACAFYNSNNDSESILGPTFTPEPQPPAFSPYHGRWYRIPIGTIPAPDPTIADGIRIYRKEKSTGKWRRLRNPLAAVGEIDDTFSPGPQGDYYIIDSWMEHEIANFPEPQGGESGGGAIGILAKSAEQIGAWRGSLVLASRKKMYFSYVGEPRRYIDETKTYPENLGDDLDNIARGRNVFLSDNRVDDCVGIVGLDSCYLAGKKGMYAVTGTLPADASPPRHLPGSRGSVSYRGSQPYGGGIMIPAHDGFYFYGVGRGFKGEDDDTMVQREESLSVRTSYERFLGNTNGSDVVLAVYGSDEFWGFNGKRYLRLSKNKVWEEGTLNDSITAACPVFGRALYAQIANGKIIQFSESATTDNGADIAWSYESGTFFEPRRRITSLQWYGGGEPTIQIFSSDGASTSTYSAVNMEPVSLSTSRVGVIPLVIQPGVKYKFLIQGTSSSDYITSLAFNYEEVGPSLGG